MLMPHMHAQIQTKKLFFSFLKLLKSGGNCTYILLKALKPHHLRDTKARYVCVHVCACVCVCVWPWIS